MKTKSRNWDVLAIINRDVKVFRIIGQAFKKRYKHSKITIITYWQRYGYDSDESILDKKHPIPPRIRLFCIDYMFGKENRDPKLHCQFEGQSIEPVDIIKSRYDLRPKDLARDHDMQLIKLSSLTRWYLIKFLGKYLYKIVMDYYCEV